MLNIAHRGYTKQFPDNTLEAFQAAIELGVDVVECDVRETIDHGFVIFHEPELQGVEIGEMSLTDVREIRLHDEYAIPTLEEALALLKDHVGLILDLKDLESLDSLLQILRAEVNPDRVAFGSFNTQLLRELSYKAPEFRRGLILERVESDPIKVLESVRCQAIGVSFPHVTEDLIERVHSGGRMIFVWGCETEDDVEKAVKLPIDGIVSDVPDMVKLELAKR